VTGPTLRRVIGLRGLTAAIFNITVGAAIFVLPAHVAASLGEAAPLAYLVCVVTTGLVALCFAEAGSRVPRSGGPYAYVATALGPYAGFLCGVLLWVGVTIAMGAVATVFADALSGLVPWFGGPAPRAVLLVGVFGLITVINITGASPGSRLSGVSTVAKLLPLLAFIVVGLLHIDPGNLAIRSLPPLGRVGEAGLLLMFAFFGMESALQVSGEVTNPARNVPWAIALALLGVALLYVSAQAVAQGVLGSALATPETASAPLAAAAARFAGPAGSRLILGGMLLSTFGFLTGMMLTTPRTLFALAADGFLPRPLARVHAGFGTPHVAILAQAVIVSLIALTGTYIRLVILADVAVLMVYLGCCVGAAVLRRRNVRAEGEPFLMPGGSVVPWLAAAVIALLLVRGSRGAWILNGAVIAIASLAYLARRWRNTRSAQAPRLRGGPAR
jgi:amino acid transporter